MSKPAECHECHKVFSHRKNLYQHQRNIHKKAPDLLEYPKNFTCESCGVCFSLVQNLYRHKKRAHGTTVTSGPVKHECSLCDQTFRTQYTYLRHLQMTHDEKSQTYLFGSKREFEVWKCGEEEKCKALFSARSCYKVFGNARRTVFLCHRYGEFKSRNTGKRCLKVQGSTREGNLCTARMEVTEFQNGEVRVVYFSRHQLHLDSVEYVGKASGGVLVEQNHSTFCRKPRIRLSGIKEVHYLAENMSPDLILTDHHDNWSDVISVISEKDSDKLYRVSLTGNPCYPGNPDKKCNLVCEDCDLCIHDYKCSCDNYARSGGLMCKHIHLVALVKARASTKQDICNPKIPDIDDSIFLEIELDEEDSSEIHINSPRTSISDYSDVQDSEIQLTTFESILNFGKNAASSELEPHIVQKINESAQESLNTLQSIIKENNILCRFDIAPNTREKVKVESIFRI